MRRADETDARPPKGRCSASAQHSYGDLTELNTDRTVLDSIGKDLLAGISNDYLELLATSSAIYEKNGDCALGLFPSRWCRLLDERFRQRCGTDDNQKAWTCGRWHHSGTKPFGR